MSRIVLKNLSKRFGSLRAVDGLNLEVRPGEIFGFLGPNGAGKTTTVKMMTGLLRPSAGTVEVAGFDIERFPLEAKRQTAMIPDEPFVYPKLTGVEFLHLIGELYEIPWERQKKRIPELLELFELSSFGGELLEGYSHGMRQKLLYCGALLREPRVFVLDEPMVGLDPKSARLVKDIFKRLAARGVTIFMCTHVLEVAEKICDRIGIFFSGKMIALGTMQELRLKAQNQASASSPTPGQGLEDVFLSLTGGAQYSALLQQL